MRTFIAVFGAFVSLCSMAACGARGELGEPEPTEPVVAITDASVGHTLDAHALPKHDAAVADAARVPLAPLCTRPANAVAPNPFELPDGGLTDAGHPRNPQVVSSGGAVASLPIFIPITFSDADPDQRDQDEDFTRSVGCTKYWQTVVSDYGVGIGIGGPNVRLTESAPDNISDEEIHTWLKKKIEDPTFPQPTPDTVYVIYYPNHTQISLQGEQSCGEFSGYHNSVKLGANKAALYAVVPDCTGSIDDITGSASHELVEAVTDPQPLDAPAYAEPEAQNLAFALVGGETGDMCEFKSDAMFLPDDYPFVVQRTWSNKSAFGLEDPCQPAAPGPYIAAAPTLNDTVNIDLGNGPQPTSGVKIAVGQSATIDIVAFANGVVPSWKITVADSVVLFGGNPELDLTLDKDQVNDGDVAHLTIHRKTAAMFGGSAFMIVSDNGSRQAIWWGSVGD